MTDERCNDMSTASDTNSRSRPSFRFNANCKAKFDHFLGIVDRTKLRDGSEVLVS